MKPSEQECLIYAAESKYQGKRIRKIMGVSHLPQIRWFAIPVTQQEDDMKMKGSEIAGDENGENITLQALILSLLQSGSGSYTINTSSYDREKNQGTQSLIFTFKQNPKFDPLKPVMVTVGFEEGKTDDTYSFEIIGLEPGEHYSS